MTKYVPPDRYRVIDCLISRTDLQTAVQATLARLKSGQGGYICFSNVHTIVMSRHDRRLRDITNASFMSVPDGKPISVLGKLMGIKEVGHIAGPDFMPHFINTTTGLKHFFYGSTPQTLDHLTRHLKQRFPDMQIVGEHSPPFRPLTSSEHAEVVAKVRSANPDIIWVGLGAPRQEYWMADVWKQLQPAILMGVGAAFDFHAGQIARAPQWMRRLSLEWLFRLCQEPRRLWRRYTLTNSLFFYYLFKDALLGRSEKQQD